MKAHQTDDLIERFKMIGIEMDELVKFDLFKERVITMQIVLMNSTQTPIDVTSGHNWGRIVDTCILFGMIPFPFSTTPQSERSQCLLIDKGFLNSLLSDLCDYQKATENEYWFIQGHYDVEGLATHLKAAHILTELLVDKANELESLNTLSPLHIAWKSLSVWMRLVEKCFVFVKKKEDILELLTHAYDGYSIDVMTEIGKMYD